MTEGRALSPAAEAGVCVGVLKCPAAVHRYRSLTAAQGYPERLRGGPRAASEGLRFTPQALCQPIGGAGRAPVCGKTGKWKSFASEDMRAFTGTEFNDCAWPSNPHPVPLSLIHSFLNFFLLYVPTTAPQTWLMF